MITVLDELLELPLMMACGGAAKGGYWTFYTPEGSVDVDFADSNPQSLFSFLDGTLKGKEIVKALETSGHVNLIEILFALIDLSIVLPTSRLYESYYQYCEIGFGSSKSIHNSQQVPLSVLKLDRSILKNTLPKLSPLLEKRCSTRQFSNQPVTPNKLLSLLWAMYGYTERAVSQFVGTVPSPGGFYSLEVYILLMKPNAALERGMYCWNPEMAILSKVTCNEFSTDAIANGLPSSLSGLDSAAMIVIVGNVRPVSKKYGTRALKFLHVEAGHCMQNAHLAATELKLGIVQIGGYDLSTISSWLGLSKDRLYIASALVGATNEDN